MSNYLVFTARFVCYWAIGSLFLVGCTSATVNKSPTSISNESPVPNTVDSSTEAYVDWRLDMLDQVNEVRTENGVSAVELCESLNKVAQNYALEMQETENFSHTGVDGSEIGDRATRGGYKWRAISENIAMGYTDVESVMGGWINSPGHFKNLVSDRVSHAGFGKADSSLQADVYWVQNFGTGGIC